MHYTLYLLFAPSYRMYLSSDKAYGGGCCSFYDNGGLYFALHCSRSRWILDSKLSSPSSVSGCGFFFVVVFFWQNSICVGVTHCAKPAVVLTESKESQNKPFMPVGLNHPTSLFSSFFCPAQLPQCVLNIHKRHRPQSLRDHLTFNPIGPKWCRWKSQYHHCEKFRRATKQFRKRNERGKEKKKTVYF